MENKVIIELDEYNKLRDFQKDVLKGSKVLYGGWLYNNFNYYFIEPNESEKKFNYPN